MQRSFLFIGATVIAVIAAAAVILALKPGPRVELSAAMLNVDGADVGGPFTLIRQDGAEVTETDVIDGPTLIYFGYTFCPDICPIDVQVMADAVEILSERGIEVRPVFVTVDPARDTPAELAAYAEAMHPRMIALTGSDEQVKAAAGAYRVYYSRQDAGGSGNGYLMQHTVFTYLELPEKGVVAMFRNGFPPEQIADDVQRVLAANGI